jgi:hypothetical protein
MKKTILGFITLTTMIFLAGCSALPFLNNSQQRTGQNGQNAFNTDPATLPVQMKLGMGTLRLDGTNLAVTPEQAKTLLPLWRALKTLSTDTNTSADEVKALNQQIEDSMTKEQVQAIQKMTWTRDDLRKMMQQYGVSAGNGGQQQAGARQTTPGASSQGTQTGGGGGGGFPGGPGGPPGGGGFIGGGTGGGGGTNASTNRTGSNRTPVPGQAARREAGGMNLLFADPVIKLLEGKIAG